MTPHMRLDGIKKHGTAPIPRIMKVSAESGDICIWIINQDTIDATKMCMFPIMEEKYKILDS